MESSGSEDRAACCRRALRDAGAGLVFLVAGVVFGGFARSGGMTRILPVVAGFLALIGFVHRALVLWNVDALVFENPSGSPSAVRPRRSCSGQSGALRLIGLFGIGLLSAVWYTGNKGPGYASPDPILTAGRSTLSASSAFKNGDSRSGGFLLETRVPP